MELATNPLDMAAIARRSRRGNGNSPLPPLNAITTEMSNVPPVDPVADETGAMLYTDP